jgi:hypothetical protein
LARLGLCLHGQTVAKIKKNAEENQKNAEPSKPQQNSLIAYFASDRS